MWQSEISTSCNFFCSPTTPGSELLRVTVTSSETDEKNATFKVVTKVRNEESKTSEMYYVYHKSSTIYIVKDCT